MTCPLAASSLSCSSRWAHLQLRCGGCSLACVAAVLLPPLLPSLHFSVSQSLLPHCPYVCPCPSPADDCRHQPPRLPGVCAGGHQPAARLRPSAAATVGWELALALQCNLTHCGASAAAPSAENPERWLCQARLQRPSIPPVLPQLRPASGGAAAGCGGAGGLLCRHCPAPGDRITPQVGRRAVSALVL